MTGSSSLRDTDLIERILAGQSEFFNVLMNRHVAAVQRCLKAMVRNRSDQEDLTQETLMKTWRHLPSFRADSSFRTWITRIAINEALQLYRRHRISRVVAVAEPLDSHHAARGDSPHDILARAEAHERVRNAMARLPAKYRQILILRELDEMSTEEAARHLDSGLPLVKSRLHRARRMLSSAILASGGPRKRLAVGAGAFD